MKRNDLLAVLKATYDQGHASRTQPDVPPLGGNFESDCFPAGG
jgi:hypothetical protein